MTIDAENIFESLNMHPTHVLNEMSPTTSSLIFAPQFNSKLFIICPSIYFIASTANKCVNIN
jgi:hypothetical protein